MSIALATLTPAVLALVASVPTSGAVAGPGQPGQEVALDLAAEITAAVDLETPNARQAAARKLAARRDVGFEELLRALRTFGVFAPIESGPHIDRVPLRVGDATEETELCMYVPSDYDPARPAPLMLAFHGTGGRGRGMAQLWEGLADELDMLVLAPTESGANDGYRFSDRERASALAALRWMRRRYNVDENRIFATGVSRGGHLAWDLALRHPDLFAAIAPMIGGPRIQLRLGQNNLRYAENVTQLPIRDLQGALDDAGLVFNVRLAFERLESFGATDARLVEFPELGHTFDFRAVDWVQFLSGARRRPVPERVVRRASRDDETRAFWARITRFGKGVDETFRPEVKSGRWNILGDEGRRRYLADAADERTARLEVRTTARGRFVANGDRVKRFELLLTEAMFDPDEDIVVTIGDKEITKKAQRDRAVLLTEFVERFDRTFLPVAEVEVRW